MSWNPIDWFGAAQQALFEGVVQPLMFSAGLGNLLEDGFEATGWLLVGVLQIGVMLVFLRALERWRPVEPVTDRAAVRTDIVYTLIHRLGLFRVLMFFTLDPLWAAVAGEARLLGLRGLQLDQLWPGVTDVTVTQKRKGRGLVSISYYSHDDLARLLELILGKPFDG